MPRVPEVFSPAAGIFDVGRRPTHLRPEAEAKCLAHRVTERQQSDKPYCELPANKPKPVHPHDQILIVIYFSFSFLTIRLLIKHSPHVRRHQESGPIFRIFLVRIERDSPHCSVTNTASTPLGTSLKVVP